MLDMMYYLKQKKDRTIEARYIVTRFLDLETDVQLRE